jgi:hypothetical protein
MGLMKRFLEEQQANHHWAEDLLIQAGALKVCEYHEYSLDQLDPGAVEEAAALAREDPPEGMTPEEAADFVRNAVNDFGEECPGCTSWLRD